MSFIVGKRRETIIQEKYMALSETCCQTWVYLKSTCFEKVLIYDINAFKLLEWNENRKVVRFLLYPLPCSSNSRICCYNIIV